MKALRIPVAVFVSIVALLAIGAAAFHYESNVDPVVYIPNPTLPSPNAFDYFVRAG